MFIKRVSLYKIMIMKMEDETIETIEFRIEKLEVEREELENEIQVTEKTIQNMKEMKDRIPVRDINVKVSRYIQDLENHKSNNEEMKEQIERDIHLVRGLNDK
jgi:predicted  nucleic acid-binding Zn-ribbon protein